MSTVLDIATYIDAQLAALTIGTNLFIGRMPETPDQCVVVYEYGGTGPTNTLGTGGAIIESPRIQISTRATNYTAAETLARSVWGVLEGIANKTLSGTLYQRVTAIQSPFPLERDSVDRILFVQNFEVTRNYG